MQQKYPRLRLAAAAAASELVRHYLRVGSISSEQQHQQTDTEKTSSSQTSCPEGGDTLLHEGFCFLSQQLLPVAAATGSSESSSPAEGSFRPKHCKGTWAVLTLCVSPQAEMGTQEQEMGAVSETAGRTQEMQRSLRLRLSEAQDRADTCHKLVSKRT